MPRLPTSVPSRIARIRMVNSMRTDPLTIGELKEFIEEYDLPDDMPVWSGMEGVVGEAYEMHAELDRINRPQWYGLFITDE